uniref:PB1-like domain-containing protein n=1 Tax=Lactuca sativa TaxID=4236 RepID=A0A9R1UUI8_LACSA|nr:hypothetical protein LSAT_V11C800438100 [Lactuca sativa]
MTDDLCDVLKPSDVGAPTWFSIKLHHGGKFTKLHDIKYIGGEVCYVDYVDIDEFSVHELDAIMLDLGYPDPRNSDFADESLLIYYHFRIPNGDFQFGLRALGNYQDVINLSKYISHNKLIEVYIDQGKKNLLTYFMSPNAKGKGQVHVESPSKNMNHGNDEPIGEFTSLILFGSKNDSFSPEYTRGRVGNSKRGEGSCSKRLNLDYIDEGVHISKENINDQDEAATSIHIDEMDGVREVATAIKEASTDNAEYEGDGEFEEGNLEYEEDGESQESDLQFEEDDDSQDSDPDYEEDEDHVDEILDVYNNIQDVDVDMGDFTLNVKANPDIPLRALQDHFQKTYQVGISMDKVFRANDKARKNITGDYMKRYELLRDNVLELQATNPDTIVKIDVCSEPNRDSPTKQFRRIYVCLGPLKKGFKACLRDLLGFDGAFMNGPFPGQVLSAVAYGIVESENTERWKWFLDNLGDDLDLGRNSNFTFISDKKKGLRRTADQLFLNSEYRYYIRHIHDNMRKRWRQTEYRDHLWRCASATTIPESQHLMKKFSQYDKEVCEWFKQIPPTHWARSHCSGIDVLISNMCEVFNGKIDNGRDKPVIGCQEYITEYLMKRICSVMKEIIKDKLEWGRQVSSHGSFTGSTCGGLQETSKKEEEIDRTLLWKKSKELKIVEYELDAKMIVDKIDELQKSGIFGEVTCGTHDVLTEALGTQEQCGRNVTYYLEIENDRVDKQINKLEDDLEKLKRGVLNVSEATSYKVGDDSCLLAFEFAANVVANGTIMKYSASNVNIQFMIETILEGEALIPIPLEEEFILKVKDALGHILSWPRHLGKVVAKPMKKHATPSKPVKKHVAPVKEGTIPLKEEIGSNKKQKGTGNMVDGQKEPCDVEEGDDMEEGNVIENEIKKEKQNVTLQRRWTRAQMKTMIRIEKSSILKMTEMMADVQVTKSENDLFGYDSYTYLTWDDFEAVLTMDELNGVVIVS